MTPKDKEFLKKLHDKHYSKGSKTKRTNAKITRVIKEKQQKAPAPTEIKPPVPPGATITAGVGIVDPALNARVDQCIKEGKHVNCSTMKEVAQQRGIKYFRILNTAELRRVLEEGTPQEEVNRITEAAKARWQAGWGKSKKHASIHPKVA